LRQPQACGRIFTNAAPTLTDSQGITGIVRTSTGLYVVTLAEPCSATGFIPQVCIEETQPAAAAPFSASLKRTGATTFELTTNSGLAIGVLGTQKVLKRGEVATLLEFSYPHPLTSTIYISYDCAADANAPDPALVGSMRWGVEGAIHSASFDWQCGARLIVTADHIQIGVAYLRNRNPTADALEVKASVSVVPGAFAPASDIGLTKIVDVPAAGTMDIPVPNGASSVTLIAPTVGSWGSLHIGEKTGLTAALQFERTPIALEPLPILLGIRWVRVRNSSAGALSPIVRFGITT